MSLEALANATKGLSILRQESIICGLQSYTSRLKNEVIKGDE